MLKTYKLEDGSALGVNSREDDRTSICYVYARDIESPGLTFSISESTLRMILNDLLEDRISQRPLVSYDVDDIVLDRDDDAWMFDGKVWTSVFAVSDRELTTEELISKYGPLRLAQIKEK